MMSLSYYLNSTGGSKSLAYSLWYKNLNSDLLSNISNISITASNEQIVYVDVQDLVPVTTYLFVLKVYDTEDFLHSDNITVPGTTKGKLFSHCFCNIILILFDIIY